ncbi:MAG: sugar ABC transporter permease [Chloroflexota bacterium]|nr:sugar ABC transporter permease [Chloroflexota bacterium]
MSARALPWMRQGGVTPAARRRFWRQTGIAYLYLAPAILLLTVFQFFPAVYAFYISLFRWDIVQGRFLGLENYQRLATDEAFWSSLGVTVWYVLLAIPAEMVLGLGIAYLLFQPIRGRIAYRTAYFLPYITSTVAAAIVWRWIYNPNNGLLNGILASLGLPMSQWLGESSGVFALLLASAGIALPEGLGWLGGPSVAMVAVALMSVWHYTGFHIVIFLAGLGGISKELYEAARMDGANEWQVFRRITLPLLSPTTFFLLTVSTIGALQAFSQIYVMTNGGPQDTTRTVLMLVFKTFYQQTRLGYGSAIAFVLTGMILALTLVNFRLVGRRVHYE